MLYNRRKAFVRIFRYIYAEVVFWLVVQVALAIKISRHVRSPETPGSTVQ